MPTHSPTRRNTLPIALPSCLAHTLPLALILTKLYGGVKIAVVIPECLEVGVTIKVRDTSRVTVKFAVTVLGIGMGMVMVMDMVIVRGTVRGTAR